MSETKYSKVKSWLKSNILNGTFQPYQKISSESELMKQFDVSRHTVRVALGELVSEGWLYKEQGSGTYVSERSSKNNQTNSIVKKNIAIITTYISDYIFPSIIRGAESVLSQEGYQVSLFSTNNDHETEKRILETVISQRFDGVIVEPTKSAISNPNINYYLNLESLKIPYIMINAFYDELEPISVTLDDMHGGYLQTEHLIKLGHKNILGFFKNDDMQGSKRMKGYLKAHRDYGIPIVPQNIITYNTSGKEGMTALEQLKIRLDNAPEKITGIISYNDELAMKIIEVLRQRNLQVPDDVSIVGFDNSFLSEVSEVKLSTVNHPKSELGEVAGKLIMELIKNVNGQKADDQIIDSYVFEPSLVIRNSTKNIEEL